MSERMTISVEDGTRAMLIELAGGERKIGAYISQLVRAAYVSKDSEVSPELAETLDRQRQLLEEITQLKGELRHADTRLAKMEVELKQLVATVEASQ